MGVGNGEVRSVDGGGKLVAVGAVADEGFDVSWARGWLPDKRSDKCVRWTLLFRCMNDCGE